VGEDGKTHVQPSEETSHVRYSSPPALRLSAAEHACKLVVFDTSPQPWRKAIFPATNALCWLTIVLRIQTLAVHVARATCLTQSRRHSFVRLKYSKKATIPNPATGKELQLKSAGKHPWG